MAVAMEMPSFSVLYNALTPLRGELLDKTALDEEINLVAGHSSINRELNVLETYLHQLKSQPVDMDIHFQMVHDYFNHLRGIYYDGLIANWWYSDEIELFETASTEIYSNIIETFSLRS